MEVLPPDLDRVANELYQHGFSTAVLGVYVTENAGTRETFALLMGPPPEISLVVGGWNITPISVQSPIGQCLIDSTLAEQVLVRTPAGEFQAEIVSVNGSPVVSPQERLRIRRRREEERQIILAARWQAEQQAHQQRLQQQQDKATLDDLKRRRKERDQIWRQQITGR